MNGISLLIYFFQVSFLRIFDWSRLRAPRLRRDLRVADGEFVAAVCDRRG